MWHPSDTAVKPIVANRRIERLPEPKFDAKALPFPALSLQVGEGRLKCAWDGRREGRRSEHEMEGGRVV
eukprot:248985-Chlamydomonas_euryale.AAC.1